MKLQRIFSAASRKLNNLRVARNYESVGGNQPTDKATALRNALLWLCNSQDATDCGGFSRAYSLVEGWGPPYPETTGYIAQTFLDCAARFPEMKLAERARRAVDWLANIQFESGAICRLMYHPANTVPSVFNTGMVLHGWVSLVEREQSGKISNAAERAVKWLAAEQEPEGYWTRNSYNHLPHAYYTMVDWALLRYFKLTGDETARLIALKHLDWVLANQKPNGWIEHQAFTTQELPLTHNHSYTTQGLVESGKILGDERFLAAARKATLPLLEQFKSHAKIPARFHPDWRAATSWECVTGNSQTAIVWRELGRHHRDAELTGWSERLLKHTYRYQRIGSSIAGINGGLPGSWPISGGYDTFTFTNHATKFFADSVM